MGTLISLKHTAKKILCATEIQGMPGVPKSIEPSGAMTRRGQGEKLKASAKEVKAGGPRASDMEFLSAPCPRRSGSASSVGVGRPTAQAVTASRGRWVSARWPWFGGVGVAEKKSQGRRRQNNYPVLGLYIGLLFAITALNCLCFSRLCLACR